MVSEYIFAAASAVYLFTLGAFHAENRRMIHKISAYFGYDPRKVPLKLKQCALKEILPPPIRTEVYEPQDVNGNVSLLELCVINKIVAESQPSRMFEFGTFDGRTTLNLAAVSPVDAKVFTIDLPASEMEQTAKPLVAAEKILIDKPGSGARYAHSPFSSKIQQFYGDTATFDFSPYFGSIDLVFIDASHAYDYVLNDSEIALKLLRKEGGIVLWHDYGVWEGVSRALNDLASRDSRFRDIQHVQGTSLVLGRFPGHL